jgi:hypothetical protein
MYFYSPTGYSTIESKIGHIAQAKAMPQVNEETQRHFEASKNRTYFGRPAKCEGPGPAYLDATIKPAFKELD